MLIENPGQEQRVLWDRKKKKQRKMKSSKEKYEKGNKWKKRLGTKTGSRKRNETKIEKEKE